MAALDEPAQSVILHPSFLDISELVRQDGRKKSVNLCNKQEQTCRAITCEFCRDLNLAILCSVLSLLFCLKLYKKEMSEC